MFCYLVFKEIETAAGAFFDILIYKAQLYKHKGKMRVLTRILKNSKFTAHGTNKPV